MCYEMPRCKWFSFNPESGEDHCLKPRNAVCPDASFTCDKCEEELDADEFLVIDEWEKICKTCGESDE